MVGVERYFHGPEPKDFRMRVPAELKNCVCFLCGKNSDGTYHIGGTGFFVAVESEAHKGVWYIYLVTAKHNIDKAKRSGYLNFHLRMNTGSGEADYMQVSDDWEYLDEGEAGDVAVMPIYELPGKFTVGTLPMHMAVMSEEDAQQRGIGIGDDILMIGLFTKRKGSKRNIPIARSGIIAAMPEESMQDEETGYFYDAYLAEIRSISGLSGSPVLVFKQNLKYLPNLDYPIAQTDGYLLGLMRAHWDVTKEELLSDFSDNDSERLNTGIAIVTPISEAFKIINGDELMKDRKTRDRQLSAKDAPTLDSGFTEMPKTGPPAGVTKQGFEGALHRANRKASESESKTGTKREP